MTEVVGILLAAGSARRFGAHKLMHPLADGTPIGIAAARALIQAVPNTIAVVRRGDHQLIEALSALGVKIVENPFADEGMGTSLAAGVSAAATAKGWLVSLADMPWVRPETIRLLADRLQNGATIVAPVYGGQRGHPVGFSKTTGKALVRIRGNTGARSLLNTLKDQVELLDVSDPGVIFDIDSKDDIQRWSLVN